MHDPSALTPLTLAAPGPSQPHLQKSPYQDPTIMRLSVVVPEAPSATPSLAGNAPATTSAATTSAATTTTAAASPAAATAASLQSPSQFNAAAATPGAAGASPANSKSGEATQGDAGTAAVTAAATGRPRPLADLAAQLQQVK